MSVLGFDCRFHYPSGFKLDFEFETDGGVTALVGPSGAGKTTVLSLIAGLLRPDSGTIRLRERVLFDSATKRNVSPEERGVGLVFQDYQLFPHLRVTENLRYGLKRASQPRFGFEKIVEVLELGTLLRRYPTSLSGGQRQRVALGRAILRSPELLLLDEPLSALDAALRASISEYLARAIHEFHIPTLLVSHDRANVESLAKSTVALEPVR